MDDWGDPWADNATKSPLPLEVKTSGTTGSSGTPTTWNDAPDWADQVTDDNDWGDFEDPWNAQVDGEVNNRHFEVQKAEDGTAADGAHSMPWTPEIVLESAIGEQNHVEGVDDASNGAVSRTAPPAQIFVSKSDLPPTMTAATPGPATNLQDESYEHPQISDEEQRGTNTIDDRLSTDQEIGEESSTRPSTSHSHSGSSEATPGSPRTSFEDELNGTRRVDTTRVHALEEIAELDSVPVNEIIEDNKDRIGPVEQEVKRLEETLGRDDKDGLVNHVADLTPTSVSVSNSKDAHNASLSVVSIPFEANTSIIGELLAGTSAPSPPEDHIDDPLGQTSSKRAWYRLIRQETMREFNAGKDDDNYVRVSWRDSEVRKRVNDVVIRWMVEDRATGKPSLGRPGATFGWDQPSSPLSRPSATKPQHPVSVSSVPIPAPVDAQSRNNEVATSPVAQFGWSSTTSPVERKKSSDETIMHDSTRVTPKAAKVAFAVPTSPKIRPMSSDMSGQASQYKHTRGSKSVSGPKHKPIRPAIDALMHSAVQKDLTISPMVPIEKGIAESNSPQAHVEQITSMGDDEDPWRDSVRTAPSANDIRDDDDDWGDMMASPTTPTAPSRPFEPEAAIATAADPTFIETTPPAPEPLKRASTDSNSQRSTAAPIDTWADADLSVFDSSPISTVPTHSHQHSTTAPPEPKPQFFNSISSVPFTSDTPSPASHSQTPSSIVSKAQADSLEAQNFAQSIIGVMPDLSYMTR